MYTFRQKNLKMNAEYSFFLFLKNMNHTPTLLIHGGAGDVPDPSMYHPSLRQVLEHGQKLLHGGASALDVVEQCVICMEDDPLFNAGKGSVLNDAGKVELDAAIMDGEQLRAGSVAGVMHIKNPIHLARLVMEKTEHVMLIGDGAFQFAKAMQVELMPDDYFILEKRWKQLEEAKKRDRTVLDHTTFQKPEEKYGTVGAVARDIHGNLAAATSTGGIMNKKFGRVGDSPIIGAGLYADNETCAVSATGYGEQFLRTVLSRTVTEFIRYQGLDAKGAADAAIAYLVRRVHGLGGIIVIDAQGNLGAAYSTPHMLWGYATDSLGVVIPSSS